jgi:HSP20 family protein
MFNRKSTALAPREGFFDPFALLTRMTPDIDRVFAEWGWPTLRASSFAGSAGWAPNLDVFEKDNRLIAKVDLPGLNKEDVKVEISDGYLAISGERKHEWEEKKENYRRCEREYGTFYRAIPLPENATLDDVKATFENGVLEVIVPLLAKPERSVRTVAIEGSTPAKSAKAA